MTETALFTKDQLAKLLCEAEQAHAEYERDELDGERDEQWAEWYAGYIISRIGNPDDE